MKEDFIHKNIGKYARIYTINEDDQTGTIKGYDGQFILMEYPKHLKNEFGLITFLVNRENIVYIDILKDSMKKVHKEDFEGWLSYKKQIEENNGDDDEMRGYD